MKGKDKSIPIIYTGGIILNITRCHGGNVETDMYKTGRILSETRLGSGRDMTTGAALAKTMYIIGNYSNRGRINMLLNRSLAGEIT